MSDSTRREFWNRALRRRLSEEAAAAKEWPADGRIRPDTFSEYADRVTAHFRDPSFVSKVSKLQPIYYRKRKGKPDAEA